MTCETCGREMSVIKTDSGGAFSLLPVPAEAPDMSRGKKVHMRVHNWPRALCRNEK